LDKKLVLVSGNNIAKRMIEYFDENISVPENKIATETSLMPFAALH
jgi:hypothetical protein